MVIDYFAYKNNNNDQGCRRFAAAGAHPAVPDLYEVRYSVQLTLWSGSVAREASDGPCIYTHPLPQRIPNPYDHLLAFSGFNFRVFSSVSFDAQVVSSNTTSMEISAEVFSTLRAFEVRFFVLLINLASQWAQVEKGCKFRGT